MENRLLSIGEMSRFTGAGVKALRYYEQAGIMKPAFTDPDSGYRYYSLEQAQLVWMIMLCVELGMPLKELPENYRDLLQQGEETAKRKIESLENALIFVDELKKKMDLHELHQDEQIYPQEIQEKYFYLLPCTKAIEDLSQNELAKAFMDVPYFGFYDDNDLSEYGLLCEYLGGVRRDYTFVEIPKFVRDKHIRVIPAGTYFCRYSMNKQIEEAPDIFAEHIRGRDSFMVVETEIIVGEHKINNPVNELRLILN